MDEPFQREVRLRQDGGGVDVFVRAAEVDLQHVFEIVARFDGHQGRYYEKPTIMTNSKATVVFVKCIFQW